MLSYRERFTLVLGTGLLLAVHLAPSSAAQKPSAVAKQTKIGASRPLVNVTSEADERTLRVQWRGFFDNHSWSELDSIANRLRGQRLRFQGGGWQLHVLYTILSTTASKAATDATWEAQIAALQEWMRWAPSSPTPRIALADTYENYAWKARCGGYADTVTPEGWKLFQERMRNAHTMLDEAKDIGRSDPEWYNSELKLAVVEGWTRTQVDTVMDEAIASEPEYFYDARVVADYLMPQWYGNPGDAEQFAAQIADRIGGVEGDATYFFVAEYLLIVERCQCLVFATHTVPWARILKGYEAVERLYGTNNFEHNTIALLALRVGDRQTARQAFKKIGDNWDPDVWGSKEPFNAARRSTMELPNTMPLVIVPSTRLNKPQ